ncbi:hypothetical protein T10_6489 [Trichinella papuae]|uniref:Uncharacterized protein n=1 Tax=Trichinella papuae TaxID=268474 RepID=A0A0V1MF04_9BILA|nr:hypothetical protein T10_6489 [Trichinella papuae]
MYCLNEDGLLILKGDRKNVFSTIQIELNNHAYSNNEVQRKRKAFACASRFHKLAHFDHVHIKSKLLDFASCI